MSSSKPKLAITHADVLRLRHILDQFDEPRSSGLQMPSKKRTRDDKYQPYQMPLRRPPRRASQPSRRRTHLMDHLTPHERQLVHEYYHEIGQKGGRLHGAGALALSESEDELGYDPRVKQGYLESDSEEKRAAVHKFLHAVQTKKNYGEEEAESELDEMRQDEGAPESDEEEASDEEEQSPRQRPPPMGLRSGSGVSKAKAYRRPRRAGPLADVLAHMSPQEQAAVHRYYRHISQLRATGRHAQGFLATEPVDEQRAVKRFLHFLGIGRHYGEEEALSELDDVEQQSAEEEEAKQARMKAKTGKASPAAPSAKATPKVAKKAAPSKQPPKQQQQQQQDEPASSQRTESVDDLTEEAAAQTPRKKPAALKKGPATAQVDEKQGQAEKQPAQPPEAVGEAPQPPQPASAAPDTPKKAAAGEAASANQQKRRKTDG